MLSRFLAVCSGSLLIVALFAGCEQKTVTTASAKGGDAAGSEADGGPAAGGGQPAGRPDIGGPAVVTLNKDYNPLKSRVLVRHVKLATKSDLEYAVYYNNVAMQDPKKYEHKEIAKKTLADLDFDGTLVEDSIVDTIDKTPLSQKSKDSPMAFFPMSEYLINWDYDLGVPVSDYGVAVSDERWGDDEVTVPFQEITKAYLHEDGGKTQMYVCVAFKPWVKFLEGVDDEDGDGFKEIYGRLPDEALDDKVVAQLRGTYRREPQTRQEVLGNGDNGEGGWLFQLCSDLYPKYNTETLDARQRAAFPDAKVRPLVGDAMKCLGDLEPNVIIAARPFEEWHVFNVFVIEGFKD